MAYDKCDRDTNADDVNDELGDEGFGGKFSFWRGGERDHNSTHYQMNRGAV